MKWLKLGSGIVAFGVLMGVREEFDSLWIRCLVGGLAGGIFGAVIVFAQRRKS